jgi:hypothetical protein
MFLIVRFLVSALPVTIDFALHHALQILKTNLHFQSNKLSISIFFGGDLHRNSCRNREPLQLA